MKDGSFLSNVAQLSVSQEPILEEHVGTLGFQLYSTTVSGFFKLLLLPNTSSSPTTGLQILLHSGSGVGVGDEVVAGNKVTIKF